MKKAIIIGYGGQDGTLLFDHLCGLNYSVLGIGRERTILGAGKEVYPRVDVLDFKGTSELIKNFAPDEIYYLAALHHSSSDIIKNEDFLFNESIKVNLNGVVNILEIINKYSRATKLFYAGSSHVYGMVKEFPQTEEFMFSPNCVYGITKTAGIQACEYYSNDKNIFAAVGILYNHESHLRPSQFLSKRIVEGAVAIKKNKAAELLIGNLSATTDWGYAGDYVRAMQMILSLKEPSRFIISSGKSHSVKEFVEAAFSNLGLIWQEYVKEDSVILKKSSKGLLLGDNTKLKRMTGWKPSIDFHGMVDLMIREELKKYE